MGPAKQNAKDKDASKAKDGKQKKDGVGEVATPAVFEPKVELKKNFVFLEKAVVSHNLEKIPRVLRVNSKIRQVIAPSDVAKIIQEIVPETESHIAHSKQLMLKNLQSLPDPDVEMCDATDASESNMTKKSENVKVEIVAGMPEIETYLLLLVTSLLLQHNKLQEAKELTEYTLQRGKTFNRRTMDHFMARVYANYSFLHERLGDVNTIRNELINAYRTSCLQHNEIGQATLLNLLLRDYLNHNLYDQAFKLISKTTFPEQVSNSQFVRYLYYVGKTQAIQLEYSDAHNKLQQSLRKAPQNTALGFRTMVTKVSIIVLLLMGDIPERSIFTESSDSKKNHRPISAAELQPYFELTNTVRTGKLEDFNKVLQKHKTQFMKDNTYTLILRLRHNVIKTGLRKINLSYSKISFASICEKLSLESPENAEFVCAKAIRDGVIESVIDHKAGVLTSKDRVDIYSSTTDPQEAFHKRITFCMDVHNEAIMGMRYPPDAYKKELESAEERLEREKNEEELQKEIDEMDEDGDLDGL